MNIDNDLKENLSRYLSVHTKIGNLSVNIILEDNFIKNTINKTSYIIHNHMLYEIYIVLNGCLTLECNNMIHSIETNHLCILPSQAYHRVINTSSDLVRSIIRFRYSCINNDLDDSIYTMANNCFDITSIKIIELSDIIMDTVKYLKNLYMVYTGNNKSYQFNSLDYYSFKSYFQLFFIELINLLSANININTTEMLNTDIQSKQSIFIDNYFFYNHQYNMTLCDLANKLNYSVAQTNRILNNLYGLSFKQKLIETRMKKSNLLKSLLSCMTEYLI